MCAYRAWYALLIRVQYRLIERCHKITMDKLKKYLPGLTAAILVSAAAFLLKILIGKALPVSELFYAIVIGLIINNAFHIPTQCKAGIVFAVKRLLRWGIILMGIKLSFVELAKGGLQSLIVVTPCILLALILVYFVARKIGMHEKLAILIGVGTSICGNSAIIATAPAIEAEDDHVAFAVATITLFGTICVFLYPLIGCAFGMSDSLFGIWVGTAVNDTSQVVAASGMYSERAQEIATITKLTRNLFMAPVIISVSVMHLVHKSQRKFKEIDFKKALPWFVFGFILMAGARTVGDSVIAQDTMGEIVKIIKTASKYCILLAISGVGMSTSFAAIKKVGIKPFAAGLAASIIMAGVSMILIHVFGVAK